MSELRRTLGLAIACSVLASCGGTTQTNNQAEKAAIGLTTPAPLSDMESKRGHRRHHRHRGTAAGAGAIAAVVGAQAVASGGTFACNDPQFLQIQKQFASAPGPDQEVDVCGKVTNVLAERDTRSGLHGYYYLAVGPGVTIEIVSDLGRMNAPAWPWVKVGDYSYVQGRYYYDNASSQGIDWTHHGTSRSWTTAGYVVVNGTEYQ